MPAVVSKSFTTRGEGFPDYLREVSRSKQIWGYMPENVESFIWEIILCLTETDPVYNFVRGPLAAGETVDLIDAFTGAIGLTPLANEDFLLKEFWINFDRPVLFTMYQDAVPDWSCISLIPAYSPSFVQALPIGWTRSQCEPITVSSRTRFRITNQGDDVAVGKAWIVGFRKIGTYAWY